MVRPQSVLGSHSPRSFLSRYWQREALLVRHAIAGFEGFATLPELTRLAARDDVESRLVVRSGNRYDLAHGPFRRADFRALPARGWTLLVQGLNLHHDDADALLRTFAFVPFARLDDVMVSYAVPGGGVGPHFDSYDVFLLQGFGRRRWRYGRQSDLSLRPGLPVKILRRFTPSHDAVLAPGDMLYLPPGYAHDGVALDACTTYSIGFRAATYTEMAHSFLDHLRDRVEIPGRYQDAGLRPAREPARIDRAMQRQAALALSRIRWSRRDVARFLGEFLSEPKARVYFDAPASPMSRRAFAAATRRRGVRLDRRAQWLFDDDALYVNGETRAWPPNARGAFVTLANDRKLAAAQVKPLGDEAIAVLHDEYRNGSLHLG
jgi:50S ribosomal protein L16 3-hydroxylase